MYLNANGKYEMLKHSCIQPTTTTDFNANLSKLFKNCKCLVLSEYHTVLKKIKLTTYPENALNMVGSVINDVWNVAI